MNTIQLQDLDQIFAGSRNIDKKTEKTKERKT